MSEKRYMPIGIQNFEDLRTKGFVYVDKTAFVYKLVTEGKPYFLSRPRRFGKSLLLSTLESYFLGKNDLFKGLAIEKLEEDGAKREDRDAWQVYPVFHIDLNAANYSQNDGLDSNLDSCLRCFEEKWGRDENDTTFSNRFKTLIRTAHKKTGKQCVILVDEYDKPLLETLENPELQEKNRMALKAFFGVIKSEDAHIRFAFLTGVTKFALVSVFSDLNNLNDISMDEQYNVICGISETELVKNFKEEIKELAKKNDLTEKECLGKLQQTYDGYHFYQFAEGMYNPFSLLNAFSKNDFRYYWFQTGTPTFLIKGIEKNNFDIRQMVDGVTAPEDAFSEYRYDYGSVEPLLYQSGYLTIKDYDKRFRSYTLKFPNEEVKYGFLYNLLPVATNVESGKTGTYVENFVKDVEKGNVDSFMQRLQSILSSVPYSVYGNPREVEKSILVQSLNTLNLFMPQFLQQQLFPYKQMAASL
ncbi:MAG: AAA family ATPase, partial [Treponema sp.]